MIVNPYTVTAMAVDTLSLGLAACTTLLAGNRLFVGRHSRTLPAGAEQTKNEDRLYLLFWTGAVLLFLRLAAWPFFYLTLHSYIHEVIGAMCLFGTRNLLPGLTRFLETLKPLLVLAAVVWLALFRLERSASRPGRFSDRGQRTMTMLFLVCGLLAGADASGELILWWRASPEFAVSCCTTVTDIPSRFTVWVPQAILGPGYERPLWLLYFGSTMLTVALALAGRRSLMGHGRKTTPLLAVTAAAAIGSAGITLLALAEVIGPMIMDLPFHHCLYCLMDEADAPVMFLLFTAGTLAAVASLPVWLLGHRWAEASKLGAMLATMLRAAALCLSASLVMNTVHLAVWLING